MCKTMIGFSFTKIRAFFYVAVADRGRGLDSKTILILILIIVAVGVFGVALFCLLCRNYEETTDNDSERSRPQRSRAVLTHNGRPTVTEVRTRTRPRIEPTVEFSYEMLRKHEIPYEITAQEEMDLHAQIPWFVKVMSYNMDQLDYTKKRNLQRFKALSTYPFGQFHRCNGCRGSMKDEVHWYRCRICVDIDFCERCFEKGPSVTAGSMLAHVRSHECAKLMKHVRCSVCKLHIIDTKYRCENCYNTYFCLGCYKTVDNDNRHFEHRIRKFGAISYIMKPVDECATTLPDEESAIPPPPYPTHDAPLLDPGAGRASFHPQPHAPSAPNVPSGASAVPDVPPPAYHECI